MSGPLKLVCPMILSKLFWRFSTAKPARLILGMSRCEGLPLLTRFQDNGKQQKQKNGKKAGGRMAKASSKGKQHFLLMAGTYHAQSCQSSQVRHRLCRQVVAGSSL